MTHADWYSFRNHVRSLKIPQSPYSKVPLKKIMIQIQLVGLSIIFHFTKLHLSKYNGSLRKTKQFLISTTRHVRNLVSRKSGFIKSCSYSKDQSAYKFHGPIFNGENCTSTSEV
jgi:hypothetical protein